MTRREYMKAVEVTLLFLKVSALRACMDLLLLVYKINTASKIIKSGKRVSISFGNNIFNHVV